MNRMLVWPLIILLAGCQGEPDQKPLPAAAPPAEATLAEQIAAVRAGTQTTILVEHTPLTDGDLALLQGLDGLTALCIDDPRSRITAEGIAALAELPKLDHLRIRGSGVDDRALAAVTGLERLKILNVPRGEFTGAGLARLSGASGPGAACASAART